MDNPYNTIPDLQIIRAKIQRGKATQTITSTGIVFTVARYDDEGNAITPEVYTITRQQLVAYRARLLNDIDRMQRIVDYIEGLNP